jgi:hypothetical protein
MARLTAHKRKQENMNKERKTWKSKYTLDYVVKESPRFQKNMTRKIESRSQGMFKNPDRSVRTGHQRRKRDKCSCRGPEEAIRGVGLGVPRSDVDAVDANDAGLGTSAG